MIQALFLLLKEVLNTRVLHLHHTLINMKIVIRIQVELRNIMEHQAEWINQHQTISIHRIKMCPAMGNLHMETVEQEELFICKIEMDKMMGKTNMTLENQSNIMVEVEESHHKTVKGKTSENKRRKRKKNSIQIPLLDLL
jgi:hypothetical protein